MLRVRDVGLLGALAVHKVGERCLASVTEETVMKSSMSILVQPLTKVCSALCVVLMPQDDVLVMGPSMKEAEGNNEYFVGQVEKKDDQVCGMKLESRLC